MELHVENDPCQSHDDLLIVLAQETLTEGAMEIIRYLVNRKQLLIYFKFVINNSSRDCFTKKYPVRRLVSSWEAPALKAFSNQCFRKAILPRRL